ncbi:MAG: hypothetical protein KAU21_10345, partial [Gammaproteobacteria bacterium]|nr:hypothetical protein [Gammaproteobacteria bacterium]
MNLKKSTLSMALASAIATTSSQAAILEFDYEGLFTVLDPAGSVLQNSSYPYYGDTTWGYGYRTQISGTLSFDTDTGAGTGTVTPFEFYHGGRAVASNVNFQAIGGSLMLGNMLFSWAGNDISTQVVLDASGLFSALSSGLPYGTVIDQAYCTTSGTCATPASDNIKKGQFPIGPSPIATSSFNTAGQTGFGTTLGQLSLGSDDGIGGSPMDNGQFT